MHKNVCKRFIYVHNDLKKNFSNLFNIILHWVKVWLSCLMKLNFYCYDVVMTLKTKEAKTLNPSTTLLCLSAYAKSC